MAFMLFMLAFGIGDILSGKTKGLLSSIIVGCSIFLVGYLTKTIPLDALASTGLVTFFLTVGLGLLVVNLGTLMNLNELLRGWKVVVIGIVGLVGLAVVAFTIGSWIFGRELSLCAAAPISGGIVATVMTANAALAAGKPDLAAYATLICAFQMFVGLPICAMCLKHEAHRILKLKRVDAWTDTSSINLNVNLRVFPQMPAWALTPSVVLAKLAIAMVIANIVSSFTVPAGGKMPWLNPYVAYLLFGIILTEIGFLERQSFSKAQSGGFMMAGIMIILPGNFASVTADSLMAMIVPMVGMLVLGAAGIALFSIIAGKLLNVSPCVSVSIGLTALLAYPATQIVTEEVVRMLPVSDEEKKIVMDELLPKMLIGGFVTVTIASVVFAGIVVPMIF